MTTYYMNRSRMNEEDAIFYKWHEEDYRKNISDYRTSINEIFGFFEENPKIEEAVQLDMRRLMKGQLTYEYIATDLSCPVILIKYLRSVWYYAGKLD